MATENQSEKQNCPTAGELIQLFAEKFAGADLYYGHGTANAVDEAAALVFHIMSLSHAGGADQYEQTASPGQCEKIAQLAEERIGKRTPLPYLLGEAWFAGHLFKIDERVLIPRSPVAELIVAGFEPWAMAPIKRILEIGTGSGCIAISCALAFPDAEVVATDISADALAVAADNVARYALQERVQLVETDHMDGVSGPFDLIVSNPPYVPAGEMPQLPMEYGFEPALGLVSGHDGLDSARRILQDAPQLMSGNGILVLEVGAQWELLDAAFPELAFTWLEFEHGGAGVALLYAESFRASA